jgi:hypothetical protein
LGDHHLIDFRHILLLLLLLLLQAVQLLIRDIRDRRHICGTQRRRLLLVDWKMYCNMNV